MFNIVQRVKFEEDEDYKNIDNQKKPIKIRKRRQMKAGNDLSNPISNEKENPSKPKLQSNTSNLANLIKNQDLAQVNSPVFIKQKTIASHDKGATTNQKMASQYPN